MWSTVCDLISLKAKKPNEVTEKAVRDSFEHPERGERFSSVEEMAEWLNGDDEEN